MKKMMIAFITLFILVSNLLNAQAQTQKVSPLDPVITKFNNGANKVNAGDYANAIADFQEVLVLADGVGATANDLKTKAQEQLPLLHYQVALNFIKQKKYEEAIPYLEKTIQFADAYGNNQASKDKALKQLATLFIGVGTQKIKAKDPDGAIKYFQSALKYSPNDPKPYLGMGIVYADKMDEQKMLTNLQKSIELAKAASDQKTIEQAQQKMGRFYINIGNADLAEVATDLPDYSSAIKNYEKAISYDPKATDAYYYLAVIFNKTLEFDKAISNSLKALQSETVDTKIAAINYELGIGYFSTADYKKACETFNKAMVGAIAEKAQARKAKVPGCK